MKRLRQPRTSIRAAALPALILAAGIGLAFYQLTPGSELTLKLKISLTGAVVISALSLPGSRDVEAALGTHMVTLP